MRIPNWFLILIALCALTLTVTEVAYRVHLWNHWEYSRDGVFNPTTGVGCEFNVEGRHVCYDLVNGRVLSNHPLIVPAAPRRPDTTRSLYDEYMRGTKAARDSARK
jgi:hypothetical protein